MGDLEKQEKKNSLKNIFMLVHPDISKEILFVVLYASVGGLFVYFLCEFGIRMGLRNFIKKFLPANIL